MECKKDLTMNIQQLWYVVAIANSGTFREAALDLLDITKYSGDDNKVGELITHRPGGLAT